MDISYLISIIITVILASIIQSSVGFAFALFATPLLMFSGMTLPNAIVTVATCSFIQALFGVKNLNNSVPWKLSLISTSIRTVMLIFGLIILKAMNDLDQTMIQFVIGLILCALVITQLSIRIQPQPKLHFGWATLAFSSSGLLAGICGMGGPPLVLWAMAHNWSTHKTRGFLFAVFTISLPIQIFIMAITFKSDIAPSILLGALLTPAIYIGVKIGLPLGNKLSKPLMRKVVLLILLAIGLSCGFPFVIQFLNV